MDHDCILRLSAVLWKTSLPKSGLYRLIKEGSFPKQVPLTARSVGWRESELERWIADPDPDPDPGRYGEERRAGTSTCDTASSSSTAGPD